MKKQAVQAEEILNSANKLRWQIGDQFHDSLMESIYRDAERISQTVVNKKDEKPRFNWDRTLDRILTSRVVGLPVMMLLLALVFWITIAGANVPSGMIASVLIDKVHPILKDAASVLPWWMSGLLVDGVYLAAAWVISVMLPPMAIFFPMFTLLEDFGYLPRVAFNLDNLFEKVAHMASRH